MSIAEIERVIELIEQDRVFLEEVLNTSDRVEFGVLFGPLGAWQVLSDGFDGMLRADMVRALQSELRRTKSFLDAKKSELLAVAR